MKKRIYYRIFCAIAVLMVLLCAAPCRVYAKGDAVKKEGTVIIIGKNKKAVRDLKGSFVKKRGSKYFKNQRGRLIKDQLL